MSTLEKTINLLNALSENQIETIYSFVQFLSSQQTKEIPRGAKPLDDILENIVGAIQIQRKHWRNIKRKG